MSIKGNWENKYQNKNVKIILWYVLWKGNSLPWLELEGLFGLKPGGVTFLFVFPFCSFSLSALFYGCKTLIQGLQLALGCLMHGFVHEFCVFV